MLFFHALNLHKGEFLKFMTKHFLKNFDISKDKKYSLEEIKKKLNEQHACYVLVTCSEPSEEGKMEVELSFGGEEALASYLLQSAQEIFDEKIDEAANSFQD